VTDLKTLAGVLLLVLGMSFLWLPAMAQEEGAPAPTADPADVESIDAIIAAVYDVISGPAGDRDWDRFRTLFVPGALLSPMSPGQDGSLELRVLTAEDYVLRAGPLFQQTPFYEIESGRRLERFGNVANAMSAYESRRSPEDPEPFQRGINSMTMVHDGERWYFVSIAWDIHRPGNEIPDGYGEGGTY
jgi:hypothetical protein